MVEASSFTSVDHFIDYFEGIRGAIQSIFRISAERSSFSSVQGKQSRSEPPPQRGSLKIMYLQWVDRCVTTTLSFETIAQLPYPAAIPEFSFKDFEGKDRSSGWTEENVPRNLRILAGFRRCVMSFFRNLDTARVVVIPTRADFFVRWASRMS